MNRLDEVTRFEINRPLAATAALCYRSSSKVRTHSLLEKGRTHLPAAAHGPAGTAEAEEVLKETAKYNTHEAQVQLAWGRSLLALNQAEQAPYPAISEASYPVFVEDVPNE